MHASTPIRGTGDTPPGVTFVIPVRNGARWIPQVLESITAQRYTGAVEIIAIDDGSSDGSQGLLGRYAQEGRIRLLLSGGMGAAAAINLGIRTATHPLIAQVDQDVILDPDWLSTLVHALGDHRTAAAQGHYVASRGAGLWSRVMALDLRLRYGALGAGPTNHVCTGNSVYRAAALRQVGLFDESLGYGYDNDLSYRLADAGHQLVFSPAATSVHLWREGFIDYARQQYGFGYGRLDLVAKHRHRYTGDDVSPVGMMLHAPAMLVAVLLLTAAGVLAPMGAPVAWLATAGAAVIVVLTLERAAAGLYAAVRFKEAAGLFFAPAHLVRDLAWAAAILVWLARKAFGRPRRPGHSMSPRPSERDVLR